MLKLSSPGVQAPQLASLLLAFVMAWPAASLALDKASMWAALRDGKAFAIMRHAIAPGFSDPNNYKVDDCSTQRNLSNEGREQAKQIGNMFRANGISDAAVFSSQWCRCLDTARLLRLGDVTSLPPLNSFFEARERKSLQTDQLKSWLGKYDYNKPLVLVTHQVNISALTGSFTSSGETIVAKLEPDGRVTVLGSLN